MANFTQSAGVPEQLYSVISESFGVILDECNVEFIVIACPIPDCGLSGATTTISPMSFIIDIKVLIPGAFMPSSFVTKISGLSIYNYFM